jgi:hypothetical protein
MSSREPLFSGVWRHPGRYHGQPGCTSPARDNAVVEHNTKLSRLKHFINGCVVCIANYPLPIDVARFALICRAANPGRQPSACIQPSRSRGQWHGSFQPCDFQDASHTFERRWLVLHPHLLFSRVRRILIKNPGVPLASLFLR